jgi:hypothetical protein
MASSNFISEIGVWFEAEDERGGEAFGGWLLMAVV